jgi:hypothetical protein
MPALQFIHISGDLEFPVSGMWGVTWGNGDSIPMWGRPRDGTFLYTRKWKRWILSVVVNSFEV